MSAERKPESRIETEIEVEPIPGLPHELPAGERILWQGRPQTWDMAQHTFQVPWLCAYFALFTCARGVFAFHDGQSLAGAILASVTVLPLAALCIGMLSLLAWLNARATVYTITTRRVVMRFGVAFPMTFNLPFKRLAAANLKTRKDGSGDIALQLASPDRIAWLHLWPHARPWRLAKAQPMLRSIPSAAHVAGLLSDAVQAWSAAEGVPLFAVERGPSEPVAAAVGQRASAQLGLAQ